MQTNAAKTSRKHTDPYPLGGFDIVNMFKVAEKETLHPCQSLALAATTIKKRSLEH